MENIYNKMKDLFGITEELSEETKMMAEAYLVDGTTIKTDADRFEEGSMVFVVGEDEEKMALPSGTYELQDGAVIEVVDGEITALKSPEATEEPVEEDMASKEKEVDLSNYMTKSDGYELGKMITEAIELKLSEIVEGNNTELEKVKKLSASKTFKSTPNSKKNSSVELKSTSLESIVYSIFNKTKNN